MANIIEMYCKDCGYKTNELRFGAFFNDPRIMGPALDTDNNEIILTDYDQPAPSPVISYTDNRLHHCPEGLKVPSLEIKQHKLMANYNFCPSCNGFTLSVNLKGFID